MAMSGIDGSVRRWGRWIVDDLQAWCVAVQQHGPRGRVRDRVHAHDGGDGVRLLPLMLLYQISLHFTIMNPESPTSCTFT